MIGSYLTPAGELGKRTKMSMIRLPRYGISPSNTSSPLYPASWSRRTVNASAGTMIPRATVLLLKTVDETPAEPRGAAPQCWKRNSWALGPRVAYQDGGRT